MVFKPGKSGNPAGRPPLPAEIRAIKVMSPAYVKRVISQLLLMHKTPAQLEAWSKIPVESGGPTNLEMIVLSIIMKAGVDGDHNKLSFLLDRTIGKVVEKRDVQLQAVRYVTEVRADGALMQEVVKEALGEVDNEP